MCIHYILDRRGSTPNLAFQSLYYLKEFRKSCAYAKFKECVTVKEAFYIRRPVSRPSFSPHFGSSPDLPATHDMVKNCQFFFKNICKLWATLCTVKAVYSAFKRLVTYHF